MMQVRLRHVGSALGLLFGWLIVQYGFFVAVFVLVMGALGWLLGRVVDGEVDLSAYVRRRESRDLD